MNLKSMTKNVQRALARYALFFFAGLLKWVPFGAVRALATGSTTIGFCFIVKQRRLARESLEIAFGREKTASEIQSIIRRCFYNFGQGMMEMLYFMAHPKEIAQFVSVEGQEHLDQAVKQGRGVIAVTAHFGNFPLMMLYFAHQGYPTNAIIRPTRDKKLEKYLFRKRHKHGIKTVYAIPRKECVVNSIKALKNNEVLFIALDQNFGSDGGVFVDFFGQKAATAPGPVIFAKRTDAVILPMFIVRQSDHRHKIIIEPPFSLEMTGEEDQDIQINIGRITTLIEHYIRRYPYEWGWMHRRWKSKDPGDSSVVEEFSEKGF